MILLETQHRSSRCNVVPLPSDWQWRDRYLIIRKTLVSPSPQSNRRCSQHRQTDCSSIESFRNWKVKWIRASRLSEARALSFKTYLFVQFTSVAIATSPPMEITDQCKILALCLTYVPQQRKIEWLCGLESTYARVSTQIPRRINIISYKNRRPRREHAKYDFRICHRWGSTEERVCIGSASFIRLWRSTMTKLALRRFGKQPYEEDPTTR